MSEESKTEALEVDQPTPEGSEGVEAHAESDSDQSELFTPERLALLKKVVPAAWLLGAVTAGVMSGVQLAFLVLAAGALTLVITLMWSSVQSLTGGASLGFEEALGMGAPSKVEEEKRAVLRALKDLEFELSVGKISPEDHAELIAKYRAEAKRLIQTVDEKLGPARQEVEKAIEKRLERAGISGPARKEAAAPPQPAPSENAAAAGEDDEEDDDGNQDGDDEEAQP